MMSSKINNQLIESKMIKMFGRIQKGDKLLFLHHNSAHLCYYNS